MSFPLKSALDGTQNVVSGNATVVTQKNAPYSEFPVGLWSRAGRSVVGDRILVVLTAHRNTVACLNAVRNKSSVTSPVFHFCSFISGFVPLSSQMHSRQRQQSRDTQFDEEAAQQLLQEHKKARESLPEQSELHASKIIVVDQPSRLPNPKVCVQSTHNISFIVDLLMIISLARELRVLQGMEPAKANLRKNIAVLRRKASGGAFSSIPG